ncbi:hypothetical protein C1645_829833 [Glomus cerebriforme]|uniref:Uncharacterized protein n=1 Tax=Glomus cerebriforme TaxID=658196 RepID=A0A397SIM7_9GLOM|nr:hypothetical protein C1645_829833 [Glomus cerebriforme]
MDTKLLNNSVTVEDQKFINYFFIISYSLLPTISSPSVIDPLPTISSPLTIDPLPTIQSLYQPILWNFSFEGMLCELKEETELDYKMEIIKQIGKKNKQFIWR